MYRTVFQLVVISKDSLPPISGLHDLALATISGEPVIAFVGPGSESEISNSQAATFVVNQGSIPTVLGLDSEGNTVDLKDSGFLHWGDKVEVVHDNQPPNLGKIAFVTGESWDSHGQPLYHVVFGQDRSVLENASWIFPRDSLILLDQHDPVIRRFEP